jgi:hypothetical protein
MKRICGDLCDKKIQNRDKPPLARLIEPYSLKNDTIRSSRRNTQKMSRPHANICPIESQKTRWLQILLHYNASLFQNQPKKIKMSKIAYKRKNSRKYEVFNLKFFRKSTHKEIKS